jgi:hypothetical protein
LSFVRAIPIRVVCVPFAAAVLAACGSSTSPPPSSFSVAAHLDSLALAAAGEHAEGLNGFLSYPVAVLGEGVSPATVTLSVNGNSQSYQGVALEVVTTTAGANPVPSDSFFVVSLWTSPDAASLVTMQVIAPDTLFGLADNEDTVTNENFDTTGALEGSVSTFTPKGKCRTDGSLQTGSYLLLKSGTCTSGTITGAFQFGVLADGAAPAHQFILASTALPAVRIVLPAGDGGTQRLRGQRILRR